MPLDTSYKEQNHASRERIHALANRLTDEEMQKAIKQNNIFR